MPFITQRMVGNADTLDHLQTGRTKRRCYFLRPHQLVVVVGTARQPSQDIFRPDDGKTQGLHRPVDRGNERHTARLHQPAHRAKKSRHIGDMFNHFHGKHHVEALAFSQQRLGTCRAVINRKPAVSGMEARNLDVATGRINADHLGAQPAHRLAQQAATAANINKTQTRKWLSGSRIKGKMPERHLADIGKPDRIEFMQRLELAVRVPPFAGKPGEALDFRRINAGRALPVGVIHIAYVHSSSAPSRRRTGRDCQDNGIADKSASGYRTGAQRFRPAGLMARLVLKFGGTSVATVERIRNVARHVEREVKAGHQVAVVVSAMSGTTNQLVTWVKEASEFYDPREYDAVVASGEQVTSGLLAIVLQSIGIKARSWQGWQIPLNTDDSHGAASIADFNGARLIAGMEQGEVAVIAGFQGVAANERIATLGRGGSDTSAVAIAAAVRADRCDIYTDVDGVYTTDPRVVTKAQRIERIAYEEMLEMASLGAKVLQVRSVEMAMVHRVPVYVRSSFDAPDASNWNGTLVCDEEEIMESQVVTGIAFSKDEAKITLVQVADKPGVAAKVFGPLADASINVDMIVQNVSSDGKTTDMTFTVPAAEFARAMDVLTKAKGEIGYGELRGDKDVVKVSCIGVGMRTHAGVAVKMFRALAERGINIQAITTSEIKISILIEAAYTELAVRALHTLYDLDKA